MRGQRANILDLASQMVSVFYFFTSLERCEIHLYTKAVRKQARGPSFAGCSRWQGRGCLFSGPSAQGAWHIAVSQ